MKKTKKLILLYFLQMRLGTKSMQQSHSYEEVYAAVPISPSTIRGILNEFEGARLLRKTVTTTSLSWQLTQTGIRTAESIFGGLYESAQTVSAQLIVLREPASDIADLSRIQIDAHSYVVFGESERVINRRFPRSLVLTQSAASGKVIVQGWMETLFGRQMLRDREQLSRQIAILFPRRNTDRVIAPRLHLRQQKLLWKLISAIDEKRQPPEIYYPHAVRMNELLRRIW